MTNAVSVVIAAVAGAVIALAIVAVDAKVTHWVIEEQTEPDLTEIRSDIVALQNRADTLGSQLTQLSNPSTAPRDAALTRLVAMFAITSWGQARPFEQIQGSDARVRACVDFILDGTGSGVECGFERANP
ncbi:MAG: hypothetical protein WEE64_11305 [Dehalococcoidia bacterium]